MDIVIPRDTKYPDAAVKFALFVTNEQNQLAFAKLANVLPSTEKALKDAYFQQVTPTATVVEKARYISAQQLQESEVLIPTLKDIKLLQKAIYENLQAAMLGEKTVDQAVTDAAQQWNNR
jgi:putative chitobiose transport system substrate-binding protein